MSSPGTANIYIQELLKKNPWMYLYRGLPRLVYMQNERVSLRKYKPNISKEEGYEMSSKEGNVLFSVWSAGDWELISGQIEIDKFVNREEFDSVVVNLEYSDNHSFHEKISLKDALRKLDVEIKNEEDLPFNQQMLDIYGQYEQDEEITCTNNKSLELKLKKFFLKDFRILRADGNCKFATAVHGPFYLYFIYFTS